ncbi:hypothetical protein [Rubrobacter indicoceani]|uniref:hypothetical protein n=1 Tax=Rubrobacter indicoceani TaxID=2051957 RepID=UPI003B839A72
MNLDLGLLISTVVISMFLAVALATQFRLDRYMPSVYWLAVFSHQHRWHSHYR